LTASDERELLSSLILDFPPPNPPDVDDALKTITARYEQLGTGFNMVALAIAIERLISLDLLDSVILGVHRYLFNDILSNAGSYRKATDPNSGLVQFGPANPRRARESLFTGISPTRIPEALKTCCSILTGEDTDPVERSIRFYQHFVAYHPFYDANGRIARFVVTMYLDVQGYYVNWKRLNEELSPKFLKRLNDCHKRMDGPKAKYEEYFQHLLHFWRKVVVKKEELEKL